MGSGSVTRRCTCPAVDGPEGPQPTEREPGCPVHAPLALPDENRCSCGRHCGHAQEDLEALIRDVNWLLSNVTFEDWGDDYERACEIDHRVRFAVGEFDG